jgi:glycosyltransferase involved in cell wall biosynthesis
MKISIIIPAYNAEDTIYNAIQSILDQVYQCFEIIVIDDRSTDATSKVVQQIINKTSCKIKLIQNKRTKGPSGARNTGILNAVGDLVAFLDADDIWMPHHLAIGIDIFHTYNFIDVLFFDCKIKDLHTGKVFGKWFDQKKFYGSLKTELLDNEVILITDNLIEALIDESFIHLQSMIVKKDKLKGILFNEKISRSEDRDFSIQLCLKNKAIFAYKAITTGIYHKHEKSLTSKSAHNSLLRTKDHITLFNSYFRSLSDDRTLISKLNDKLHEKHLVLCYLHRELSQYKQAFRSLFHSLKYDWSFKVIYEFIKTAAHMAVNLAYQITQKK